MTMTEIRGKKVLIVGFGREGQSVLRYLHKNFRDIKVSVADRNPEALKYVQHLEVFGGEDYLKKIAKFDTVVKSPGIRPSPEFKRAKHITTLTNIFMEAAPGRIIGITGTKGKSTTASLIAHILQNGLIKTIKRRKVHPDVRLVGNVGKPALDHLEDSDDKTIFVMEMSSYQLNDIRYSPHIAVLLPIYAEHLNYHGTMKDYVSAKANITKYQSGDDYFLYYRENKYCQEIAKSSKAIKIPFRKFIGDTPLLGEANQINTSAAIFATNLFIKSGKKIYKLIQSFKPLPHRLERVGKYRGIEFVNDSLATIPEATMHALEAMGGKAETLIAGGYDRGIGFSKLGPAIVSSGVKVLILFPDTGKKIEQSLPKNDLKIFHTDNMKEAVKLAYEHTSKGKTVLMSPASTSFNLFADYEDRGEQFKKYVRELK